MEPHVRPVPQLILPGLFAILLAATTTLHASCVPTATVKAWTRGDLPKELIWNGQHYSSVCDCRLSISGAGEPEDAAKTVYCTLGSVCRCGTLNDKPLMGKVISQPGNPIRDYSK